MTLASESPFRRALYRALHDPLTGLANRGLLMDQLGRALARARRRPGSVAVIFLDVERLLSSTERIALDRAGTEALANG